MTCPWGCGCHWYTGNGDSANTACYSANENICRNVDKYVADIRKEIEKGDSMWGDDSVYSAGDNVAWDGLYNWEGLTTGMGWTGWWVGLSDYCVANDYWASSNAKSNCLWTN